MSLNKNINSIKAKFFAVVGILFFMSTQAAYSSNEKTDWILTERENQYSNFEQKSLAKLYFEDDQFVATTIGRDLRMMIAGAESISETPVNILESSEEISVEQWLKHLPTAVQGSKITAHTQKSECSFNSSELFFECEIVPTVVTQATKLAEFNPQIVVIASEQIDVQKIEKEQAPKESVQVSAKVNSTEKTSDVSIKSDGVRFYKGPAGVVTVKDGKLRLENTEKEVQIVLSEDVKKSHVSMFVRDPSVATIDLESLKIKAHIEGKTELFVVSKDRISIIPVYVGADISNVTIAQNKDLKKQNSKVNPVSSGLDLKVPESLASLDHLDKAVGMKSSFSVDAKTVADSNAMPEDLKVPEELNNGSLDALKNVSFSHAKSKTSFTKMFVRVVDERTSWDLANIYPVGGVRVRLLGSDFEVKTDSRGYAEISDIPTGSRLLAEIIDDSGKTVPAFTELVADGQSLRVQNAQVVMVRRSISMDYSARMARVVQDMQRSSLCSTVVNSSKYKTPKAGFQATTNAKSIGPFYFNDLGYLDTRMNSTGSSGRFCYFNVEPGVSTFGIISKSNRADINAVAIMTAAGRHTEEVISLEDARHVTTTIASISTAAEQLSSSTDVANKYLAVDQAEVSPLGYSDAMLSIDEGVLTSATPVVPVRGRVWTVSSSADFESSLQAMAVKLPGHRQITSLIPRGFIDDMSNYAQTTQDQNLGVVIVEHAAVAGQGSESVKIRLIDTQGKEAGDGWYFSDLPIAKAVFFNVPPGVYSVLVETASGHWVAADTAVSYEEMSTFVRTGAPLEKHLLNSSAQN